MKAPDVADRLKAGERIDSADETDLEPWSPPKPGLVVCEPTPWPEIEHFGYRPRPTFPVGTLPPWMRSWAEEAGRTFQVEADAPATLALAVLACAAARHFDVEVRPQWIERLALWVLVPLRSGERKTPLLSAAQAPLVAWETRARQEANRRNAETADEREVTELARKRLRKAAADALEPQERGERLRKLAALKAPPIVAPPLIAICDPTPERLIDILNASDECVGILSTEGEIIGQILGRYSDTDAGLNVDGLLKCYSGERLTVHRKTSGDVVLHNPVVSIALMTQPEMVHRLMGSAELAGRGLLARFLYSVPRSMMGARDSDPPRLREVTEAAYANAVRSVLDTPRVVDEDGAPVRTRLRFEPDARARVQDVLAQVEPTLALGESSEVQQSIRAKLCGSIARIASLFALGDAAGDGSLARASTVRLSHVDRAVEVGRYYEAHAFVAYDEFGLTAESRRAHAVLAWLRRRRSAMIGPGGHATFRARDVLHQGAAGLQSMTEVNGALADLERRHYIRRLPMERAPGARGRSPSPTFELHPDA